MKKESLLKQVNVARDKHINLLIKIILDDPMLEDDDKDWIKDELYSLLYDLIPNDGTVAVGIFNSLYKHLSYGKVKSNDP